MRRAALVALGSVFGAAALLAAEPRNVPWVRVDREHPRRIGSLGSERKDRANDRTFLLRHQAELAYPADPRDPTFQALIAPRAAEAARAIRVRGRSRANTLFWHPLGPDTIENAVNPSTALPRNITGRVTALAIAGPCSDSSCRLWVGTAGGGLWTTDQALDDNPPWQFASGSFESNAIGSIAVDPNDPSGRTVYVGTGEANFTFTSGAGAGVYVTDDGGANWNRLPTIIDDAAIAPSPIDFTMTRGISRVAAMPGRPGTILVATAYAMAGMTAVRGGQSVLTGGIQPAVGLYRTDDGGASWRLMWQPPEHSTYVAGPGYPPGVVQVMEGVRDFQFDPEDPETIYATAFNNGIFRSSSRLEGGDAAFKPVFRLVGSDGVNDAASVVATAHGGRTRVYAGNGVADPDFQAIYRCDDADVPAAALASSSGTGFVNSDRWLKLTSTDPSQPGYTSLGYCRAQCTYDQVLAVPMGAPDILYAGGQAGTFLGDPVIRSEDAGASFGSFGFDAQLPPGITHADVHAIVFDPDDPAVVFVGSDGGVARSSASRSDGTALCTSPYLGFAPGPDLDLCHRMRASVPSTFSFLNRGLRAIQFFNIAADPNDPLGRWIAGAQDNSTLWHDRSMPDGVWASLFPFGDGTSASGFHPADPDILFASFQSMDFFTNFHGGTGGLGEWVWTSGPIQASGERASGAALASGRQFLTLDPVHPDTQFAGFEHVWRTTDDGGDRTILEANCGVLKVFSSDQDMSDCGDWQPLGAMLTDASFGDRAGGIVVAAARTRADSGTLWAATSLGRLFRSSNADAPDAADVAFSRLDAASSGAPGRFVSAIAADPGNPNRTWVSFSGFSALTPGTPGHVFEVVVDTGSGSATWTSLDGDLGDLPIDDLVRDDKTGDLYAATDFGVLRLPAGSAHWEEAGSGLPVVLTPGLEIFSEKRLLLAGTHGMGAWALTLP